MKYLHFFFASFLLTFVQAQESSSFIINTRSGVEQFTVGADQITQLPIPTRKGARLISLYEQTLLLAYMENESVKVAAQHLNGSEEILLCEFPDSDTKHLIDVHASVSNDKNLVCITLSTEGIYIIDLKSGDITQKKTSSGYTCSSWSPDDNLIAFLNEQSLEVEFLNSTDLSKETSSKFAIEELDPIFLQTPIWLSQSKVLFVGQLVKNKLRSLQIYEYDLNTEKTSMLHKYYTSFLEKWSDGALFCAKDGYYQALIEDEKIEVAKIELSEPAGGKLFLSKNRQVNLVARGGGLKLISPNAASSRWLDPLWPDREIFWLD